MYACCCTIAGTAYPTGGFGQLPLFSVIFVEDYAPTVGDNVSFSLTFSDPDSTTTLTVTPGDLSATVVGPWAALDCTSSSCTQEFTLIIGATTGPLSMFIKVVDDADATKYDERQLDFNVQVW